MSRNASRRLRRLAAAAGLAAVLAGLVPGLPPQLAVATRRVHAADSDEVARLKREIQAIQQQIRNLERNRAAARQQLAQLRKQERTLTAELERLDNELEGTRARLDKTRDDLTRAEAELRHTQQELIELERRLLHLDRLRDARVRALYEQGTVSVVEVLLDSQSFADFLRRFTALQEILANDVRVMSETQELRDEVAVKKAELEEKREEIAGLLARIQSYEQRLEQLSAEKESTLEQVRSEQDEVERILDQMDAQLQAASDKLTALQRKLDSILPKVGKMVFPLDTSGYWRFSSEFGMRWHPILKRNRMHTGLDIAARRGTRVFAAAPGQVGYAGWMGGYGKVIIILHHGGLQTVYAHLDAILVKVGQNVQAGDTIGRVGSTGYSTGPHLHFEVRKDGKPVNPRGYLMAP